MISLKYTNLMIKIIMHKNIFSREYISIYPIENKFHYVMYVM